jgi:hypothetical protein
MSKKQQNPTPKEGEKKDWTDDIEFMDTSKLDLDWKDDIVQVDLSQFGIDSDWSTFGFSDTNKKDTKKLP